ncbi:MAG: hypothetical protein F6K28_49050 [Microcoleus sp. SIO2G3]|nr:hypothetical protein [Microcoleus sp. SIO2G3]
MPSRHLFLIHAAFGRFIELTTWSAAGLEPALNSAAVANHPSVCSPISALRFLAEGSILIEANLIEAKYISIQIQILEGKCVSIAYRVM